MRAENNCQTTIFIQKSNTQRTETLMSHPPVHSLNDYNNQMWGHNSQEHEARCKSPSISAISCCLQGCTLAGSCKQSQDILRYSDTECSHLKQHLKFCAKCPMGCFLWILPIYSSIRVPFFHVRSF